MKKIVALTLAVFFILCFSIAFNTSVVKNFSYGKNSISDSTSANKINTGNAAETTAESTTGKDDGGSSGENIKEPGQAEKEQDNKGAEQSEEDKNKEGQAKEQDKTQEQDKEAPDKAKEEQGKDGEDSKAQQDPKDKQERIIDPKKPMVALTFDDGPHPKYTLKILDALEKYKGRATFFVLGSRAEKYKNVIKSIDKNGNQIGNHTYDHKELTKLKSSQIINEITKTSDILNGIIGSRPDTVRPTYGSINNSVKLNAGAPLILWSIDTRDWKTRNKQMIINEVKGKVKDGDIVLMHDIYSTTADAAEVVIKDLSSKGYQLVTVNELYKARGIDMVNGKAYYNAYKKKK